MSNEEKSRTEQILERLAENQFNAEERLAKWEETVSRLSDTLDRYLNARLNGGKGKS